MTTIETAHCIIRFPKEEEWQAVRDYYQNNRMRFSSSYFALNDHSFFEQDYIRSKLKNSISWHLSGTDFCTHFYLKSDHHHPIGHINFTDICGLPFSNCYLGYGIDKNFEGKGIMHEVLGPTLDFVCLQYNIHKILAFYMTSNIRSGCLLEKLGFIKEGIAREEKYINGRWEDHVIMSYINKEWKNAK